MKKLLILTVFLAIVAAVAVSLAGAGASKVDAASCIRCGPGGGTTASVWGFGSTCAAANNDALNQAIALIPGSCSSCSETVLSLDPCNTSCTNVATCYTPYGQWRVDIKLKFKCELDLCF